MTDKVLILGGTREAGELAAQLVSEGHDVTTSLAGRTRKPEPLEGTVRVGGFGGAEGLAAYLREGGFTRLVDATHPFAKKISANARKAAAIAGIAFESRVRHAWKKQRGDNWIEVSSLGEARDKIPSGARVLLALGSQHIGIFGSRADVHFVVRMVDPPDTPLPLPDHELVIGLPGSTVQEEVDLLRNRNITHIVCRNSGGSGAYAKIAGAREMELPVIIVAAPFFV